MESIEGGSVARRELLVSDASLSPVGVREEGLLREHPDVLPARGNLPYVALFGPRGTSLSVDSYRGLVILRTFSDTASPTDRIVQDPHFSAVFAEENLFASPIILRQKDSLEESLHRMKKAGVSACLVFDEKDLPIGVLNLSGAICALLRDHRELSGQNQLLTQKVTDLTVKTSDWLQKMEELLGFSRSIRERLTRPTLETSLLESGIEFLSRLIGARYVAIGMLDDKGVLGQFLYTGMEKDAVDRIGNLPEGKGLLGVVIRQDMPIRLDRIGTDPRSAGFPVHHPEMTSLLAVPISSMGTVYGRIYLSDKTNGESFTDSDEKLVLSFAHSLSLILDNAHEMDRLARTQSSLLHLAMYDPLTDLPNRKFLHDALEQILSRKRKDPSGAPSMVAFLFIDLDNFKFVNDSLGHQVGDQVLVKVGAALLSSVRETDLVSRIGGDEFAILIEDPETFSDLDVLCRGILDAVVRPISLETQEVVLTASIGVALYPDHGSTVDALMKNADLAMYEAKDAGRNNFRRFSGELERKVRIRHDMENYLRQAIAGGEFCLHYQPKINMRRGEITGFEALLRWPARNLPPGDFIPVAEESGLIVPIGEWVVRTACTMLGNFSRWGYGHLSMGVNLSVRQFWNADFPEHVRKVIDETRCRAGLIEFEITESQLMKELSRSNDFIRELKSLGVKISVDDFGTGYSSLSYLKNIDFDSLKVDQSFIRDSTQDSADRLIVRAIIAMAHGMRIGVVAEGVETQEQFDFLKEEHCDEIQGYFISRPIPEGEVLSFLKKNRVVGNSGIVE